MNEEKINELMDMGFTLDEALDTLDIIKDMAEGELREFIEKVLG